jgi:hypothetical protein
VVVKVVHVATRLCGRQDCLKVCPHSDKVRTALRFRRVSRWNGELLSVLFSLLTICCFLYSIKVSLLVPLPAQESALVQLNLRSLVVSSEVPSSASGKGAAGIYDYFLTKDIQIRGLSISLNRVAKPSTTKEMISLAKHTAHVTTGIILNPCNVSSQVFGRKDKQSELRLQNLRTLAVQTSLSNMEWTPSCDHLFLIRDILGFLEQEDIKYRYQVIRALLTKKPAGAQNQSTTEPAGKDDPNGRRHHSNGATQGTKKSSGHRRAVEQKPVFNPREVWVFAIRAILVMVKEKRSGGRFRPQLRSGMERLGLRRQYLDLYRKVLQAKLQGDGDVTARQKEGDPGKQPSAGDSKTAGAESAGGVPVKSTGTAVVREVGLTDKEALRYLELHTLFRLSDLVLFRATVLQEFRNKGVTGQELKQALSDHKPTGLLAQWLSGSKKAASSGAQVPDKGSQNSASAPVSADEAAMFTFDVKLTLARLSVAIFDNPLDPHHANNRRHASDTSHLNFSTPAALKTAAASGPSVLGVHMRGPATADVARVQERLAPSAQRAATDRRAPRLRTPGNGPPSARQRVRAQAAVNTAIAAADALVLPKQCFSIVFYGVHTRAEWAGALDQMGSLTLGAVRAFGHRGTELISCGGDSDYWMEFNFADEDAGRAGYVGDTTGLDTSKALQFSLKWCQTVAMSPYELALLKRRQKEERRRNRRQRTTSGDASNEEDFAESSDTEDTSVASDSDEAYEDAEEGDGNNNVSVDSRGGTKRITGLHGAYDKYASFDGDRTFSARAMSSAYRNLMKASNKHLVVEFAAGFITLNWHRKSALFLTDLSVYMMPPAGVNANGALFPGFKAQAAQLSYFRAMHGIVRVPAKVSVEAKCLGLLVRVPIQNSAEPRVSGRRFSRSSVGSASLHRPFDTVHSPFGASHNAQTPAEAQQYVYLSVGKLSLAAGDYLTSQLNERRREARTSAKSPGDDANYSDKFAADDRVPTPSSGPTSSFTSDSYLHSMAPSPALGAVNELSEDRRGRSGRRHSSYGSHRSENTADGVAGEAEDEVTPALTPEEKIRDLVMALRSEFVRPMAFSVTQIELCIVENGAHVESQLGGGLGVQSPSLLQKVFSASAEAKGGEGLRDTGTAGTRRSLTGVPWVIRGVFSPNVVPNNPAFTQLRVDLICDPLQMVLSTHVSVVSFLHGSAITCNSHYVSAVCFSGHFETDRHGQSHEHRHRPSPNRDEHRPRGSTRAPPSAAVLRLRRRRVGAVWGGVLGR